MKGIKIGVITMFYGSENYGGVLQAYALIRYLSFVGYIAEQICYDRKSEWSVDRKIKEVIKSFTDRVDAITVTGTVLNMKRKCVAQWALANVRHSKQIYSSKTIKTANEHYDVFIAGSDQIWTNAFSDVYLLDFVSEYKVKISYAASMGKLSLSDAAKSRFKKRLKLFKAVSVRENDAVDLLRDCVDRPVRWCVDPTLLLTKEQWEEITSERLVCGRYLFCYFMGSDNRLRLIADEYAKKRGLIIVTFPHLHKKLERADLNFGDRRVYDATPADLLSYIAHADMVFTDSYHVSVFSCIFEKQFFVFNRVGANEMKTRIYSLIALLDSKERFCDTDEKFNLKYIEENMKLSCANRLLKLNGLIDSSKEYIADSLKKTKKRKDEKW